MNQFVVGIEIEWEHLQIVYSYKYELKYRRAQTHNQGRMKHRHIHIGSHIHNIRLTKSVLATNRQPGYDLELLYSKRKVRKCGKATKNEHAN